MGPKVLQAMKTMDGMLAASGNSRPDPTHIRQESMTLDLANVVLLYIGGL